jgi:hypothetical protein
MQGHSLELENVIHNIEGIWYNPLTRDIYRFGIEKDHTGFSEVFVRQYALGNALKFSYQIIKDEYGFWLEIDKNKMKILKLSTDPQSVLTFISSNNNIVSLFKDYSEVMEKVNL